MTLLPRSGVISHNRWLVDDLSARIVLCRSSSTHTHTAGDPALQAGDDFVLLRVAGLDMVLRGELAMMQWKMRSMVVMEWRSFRRDSEYGGDIFGIRKSYVIR